MCRKAAGVALAWLVMGCAPAYAQQRPTAPLLTQVVAGRVELAIASGRIVSPGGRQLGNGGWTSSSGSTHEELSSSGTGESTSLRYQRTSPQEDFSLSLDSAGHFRFRRHVKESSAGPVELVQTPGDPLVLSVGPQDHQQVYRGATLWHLAATQPDLCQTHVYPVLELLRPQWQLAQLAARVETQLLRLTADDRQQERQRWDILVAQLADERFGRRDAADRGLRAGGGAALAYLKQLDLRRLEPEQQFRIRRILHSAGPPRNDDTPEQAAGLLAGDPAVWLALAARPDPSIRQTAVQRLTALLGETIHIDPAADPATQKPARDALRARLEK